LIWRVLRLGGGKEGLVSGEGGRKGPGVGCIFTVPGIWCTPSTQSGKKEELWTFTDARGLHREPERGRRCPKRLVVDNFDLETDGTTRSMVSFRTKGKDLSAAVRQELSRDWG